MGSQVLLWAVISYQYFKVISFTGILEVIVEIIAVDSVVSHGYVYLPTSMEEPIRRCQTLWQVMGGAYRGL